ncbi:MAG: tRNA threonylcarbamoyladenosine dehydratase [Ruminococcaceae bacterium]|nr:tRNA threonylcarbamoyladenosine dehydratase [Oscillospiraceae bacterium]
MDQFSRFELLVGSDALGRIKRSRVAVFGIGGVGGYVAEALARSGVGTLDIIDNDSVSLTNLNRQIIALHSTVGKSKVAVMKERILDINPDCTVNAFELFFGADTEDSFDFTQYDYVVDAIDTVTAKLRLIEKCTKLGVPVISSMGTGNKLDPSGLEITDISKTSYDGLARIMRKELSKRGIKHLPVVYSAEQPVKPDREKLSELLDAEDLKKRTVPASSAFVPPCAGLMLAAKVLSDLGGVSDG